MSAMHFPVLSDLVDRGRQLCFYAYLIAGGLYTTIGMVSQKASPASADELSRNRWFAATQRDEACHLLTFEAEELPPRPGFWLVKPVEEEVSGRRSGMHLSSQLGLSGPPNPWKRAVVSCPKRSAEK